MVTVSAIIPTWNRVDLLANLLPNLRGQSRPPDEVIVVDNGSTDGSQEVSREHGATVIGLPTNLGFAAAVNGGIQHAKGDWLLLLNNDVVLQRDWLEYLVRAAEAEGVLFATGKLLQTSNANRIDGTWDMISRGAHAWRAGYGQPDGELWSTRRKIWFAPMTAAIFHRSLFQRIGVLDTRFEAYYEDVDFGIRCALAGIHGVYEPAAVAEHMGKSTFGRKGRRVFYLSARNQMLLLAKHYSNATLRRFAWPILIGQLLAIGAAASHGHMLSAIKGKFEALRRWSSFRDSSRVNDAHTESIIESTLIQNEREIHDLQKTIGFDPYWRLYFSLVRS